MRKSNALFEKLFKHVKILLLFTAFTQPAGLHAQMNCSVNGKIVEENSNLPVPFATVGLVIRSEGDPHITAGTITDKNGSFTIGPVNNGEYWLQASSVGYKTAVKKLDIRTSGMYDAGTIYLQDSILLIGEATVVGNRMRAKTENEKTVFFMSKKIHAASGNATDMLRHIPGIQVDLKQNISLNGSRDILLFVNGKERDKSYINQINPLQIDRVEIMNTPPSKYDGNVSGVINIVLKSESETGFSGQIFTEIPTSKSIVYSFPNYSMQYVNKKINLFTSYNGEINFEDIDEVENRQISGPGQTVDITSVEQVRQKNLSHTFHYGFDYHATPRDVINYYGSVNPYTYEQDGKTFMDVTGNENRTWMRRRDETDKNLNIFNSLYYKHLFNKQGSEISIDISNSFLKSSSSISYVNENEIGTASIMNVEKPEQVATSIKIDYTCPLGDNLMLNTGGKAGARSMRNETATAFGYNEQVYAHYGTMHYKQPGYNFNLGLRTEYAATELKNDFNKTGLSILPYTTFQYKLNGKQNLRLSYRRSVNRPNVFQLNPYILINNPRSVRKGNPLLEPEYRDRIDAEHSVRFNGSYVSCQLFYEHVSNAMDNLTFLNDSAAFETQVQNLGNIRQAGIQFRGSLKFGPLTISPSLRLYHQSTSVNSLAEQYNIENRNNWVLDAGFSSVLSFRHDFAFSGTLQYATVKYHMQENTFSNALYLLSLDKTFKNNLKVGLMAALPFARTFVYQGTEIEAQHFTSSYRGNLKLPGVPLMFRLSYHFQTGKEKKLVQRKKEVIPKKIKAGL